MKLKPISEQTIGRSKIKRGGGRNFKNRLKNNFILED